MCSVYCLNSHSAQPKAQGTYGTLVASPHTLQPPPFQDPACVPASWAGRGRRDSVAISAFKINDALRPSRRVTRSSMPRKTSLGELGPPIIPGRDAVQNQGPRASCIQNDMEGIGTDTTPASWRPLLLPMPTWNIALGLNASREVSVLGDGMTVVVQWGELGRDLGVAWHQHWRKNCPQGRHNRGGSVPGHQGPSPQGYRRPFQSS